LAERRTEWLAGPENESMRAGNAVRVVPNIRISKARHFDDMGTIRRDPRTRESSNSHILSRAADASMTSAKMCRKTRGEIFLIMLMRGRVELFLDDTYLEVTGSESLAR
jgi:hypothetical protein